MRRGPGGGRLCALAAALLAVVTVTPPAPAQSAPGPAGDTVDAHLARGVELRRSGRDEEAVAEFAAAYAARAEPRTAAQLALAQQAAGHWLEADRLLVVALASPDDAWIARNRAALDAAREAIDQHVGSLEIRGGVAGAEVFIGGERVGVLPLDAPLRVLAGTVDVVVRAPGYVAVARQFGVNAGQLTRDVVRMAPLPVGPIAPPEPAPPPTTTTAATASATVAPVTTGARRGRSDTARPAAPLVVGAGIALAGVGAAALLSGALLWAVPGDATLRYDAECPALAGGRPPAGTSASCLAYFAEAERDAAVATGLLLSGGAAAVAGALLVIVPLLEPRGAARRGARPTVRSRWACAPTLAAAARGVACGVAF